MSTRGGAPPVSFREAVDAGVAPDGGLYVPLAVPTGAGERPGVDEVLAPFLAPEFTPDATRALVREMLSFSLPLRPLEGSILLLELGHGPTAAFKDVGARFLARIAGGPGGPTPAGAGPRTVLVATSGDTGGAVAAAFDGVSGARVVVFFPEGRVTPLQRRQFTTLGSNVTAVAVPGPFDRCQALVREALGDAHLRIRHRLTSANSINLGRLLPQMLYYVHAARLLEAEETAAGARPDPPTFVVPSGNLGNLTAGLLAARVAIPGARFVGAVNRNRALVEWCAGEPVRSDAPTVATPSTAMDVGRPSNLERLAWLADGSPTGLAGELTAASVDDEATLATIRSVHAAHGHFICPHTAVGVAVARQRVAEGLPGPVVVLSTAHPAKFADVVGAATGAVPPLPPRLARLEGRRERITPLPGGPTPVATLLASL